MYKLYSSDILSSKIVISSDIIMFSSDMSDINFIAWMGWDAVSLKDWGPCSTENSQVEVLLAKHVLFQSADGLVVFQCHDSPVKMSETPFKELGFPALAKKHNNL